MKKLAIVFLIISMNVAAAQPPKNSVTLNWTNPTAYQDGQPLAIGQVTIFVDVTASGTSISGAPTTFTTGVMAPGTHTFNVVVCDNQSPNNCSQPSNTATVSVPSGSSPVVPTVNNLTATVN